MKGNGNVPAQASGGQHRLVCSRPGVFLLCQGLTKEVALAAIAGMFVELRAAVLTVGCSHAHCVTRIGRAGA